MARIGFRRKKRLSGVEAAGLLGMRERYFRRLRDAYEAKGAVGPNGDQLYFSRPNPERDESANINRRPAGSCHNQFQK